MREILLILALTVGGILGILGIFLAVETIRDYNPPEVIDLPINGNAVLVKPDELSIITWNIGYAGLGKNMDFFFDGGKMVKPPKDEVVKNLEKIKDFLKTHLVDIFLLQEVDKDSDRTYRIDQVSEIVHLFEDRANWIFATNYLVDFVPVPITNPMGKVYAGQLTISKYMVEEAKRYKLPGEYPWPEKLFFLDRCFIYTKIKAKDGKYWIIINTHNSAYDKGGKQRALQMKFIKDFIIQEYKKGNYVIVGGDWNNILPGVKIDQFKTKSKALEFYIKLPEDWTPEGWKWAYDITVPTNRSVDKPYIPGDNYVTIIDGFLVSPNLEIVEVKGFDLGFENSDHNPVYLKVRIKEKR